MKRRWVRKSASKQRAETRADEQFAKAEAFFAENHRLVLKMWADAQRQGWGTDMVVILLHPDDEAAKVCAEVFKTELRGPTVVAIETDGCMEWLESVGLSSLATGVAELGHFPNIAFVVFSFGHPYAGALRNAARYPVPSD